MEYSLPRASCSRRMVCQSPPFAVAPPKTLGGYMGVDVNASHDQPLSFVSPKVSIGYAACQSGHGSQPGAGARGRIHRRGRRGFLGMKDRGAPGWGRHGPVTVIYGHMGMTLQL